MLRIDKYKSVFFILNTFFRTLFIYLKYNNIINILCLFCLFTDEKYYVKSDNYICKI